MVAATYKQTDIGSIPNDWEVKILGELAKVTKLAGFEYSLHFNSYNDGGEIIVIRGTNITHSELDLSDIKTIPISTSNKLLRSKLYKNDLVFAYVGTIGPVYLVEENDRFHLGPNTSKITVKKDLNSNYLFHYFKSSLLRNEMNDNISIGAQPSLSMSKIRSFRIITPPPHEQQLIAQALSNTDALITNLQQLIAKKQQIKQGAMQQLLQPKEGWGIKKLGEIGECIIGLTYSPENVKESGTLVLRSSNVQGCTLKFEDNVYVDCKVSEKLINKENDILICVRNGSRNLIGKCALIKGIAIGETFGAFMSVFRSPFNEYVFILFQSDIIKKQIDEHLGATINQITNKSLNSFEIPFPPIEEQTQIATILSDMDNEINALETKLLKYKNIKQGMMQNLLTGKIRLV